MSVHLGGCFHLLSAVVLFLSLFLEMAFETSDFVLIVQWVREAAHSQSSLSVDDTLFNY